MLHPFPEQTLHSLPDETAPDTSCEPSDRMPRFAPDEMPLFQPLATLAVNPLLSIEHTADHRNCPACTAQNNEISGIRLNFAELTFLEAAVRWVRLRQQSMSLKPRTHEATLDYINALQKFFAAVRMCDITPGHLRAYQLARLQNSLHSRGAKTSPWGQSAGHSRVNHEISTLGQMLRHCRLWQRLAPFYFPLPVQSWSPRTILSEEEEEQLFQIASRHPEMRLAYLVAAITANTGAAGIELRGLRLKHLFLPARAIAEIYIPEDSVKNNARPRKIALNPTARWAVEECLKRALKLGSTDPEHYLFPFRISRTNYDPTRPPSRWWLSASWEKLRAATGFHDLRPHDLRHHFATKLLEADVNIETAKSILGHISPRMTEYYAHQRKRVKYAAVMAIEPRRRA